MTKYKGLRLKDVYLKVKVKYIRDDQTKKRDILKQMMLKVSLRLDNLI